MSRSETSDDAPTRANHDKETPVNDVRLRDGSLRQFVIDECVLCGETHWHGSMDPTVANGGRSHRAEHCPNIDHVGGYYLQLAADAEPPERWYTWVNEKSGIEVNR